MGMLLSKDYARSVRLRVKDFESVKDPSYYGPLISQPQDSGTTHVSILAPGEDAIATTPATCSLLLTQDTDPYSYIKLHHPSMAIDDSRISEEGGAMLQTHHIAAKPRQTVSGARTSKPGRHAVFGLPDAANAGSRTTRIRIMEAEDVTHSVSIYNETHADANNVRVHVRKLVISQLFHVRESVKPRGMKCKKKCLEMSANDNCIGIFTKFYNMTTKDQQDPYLQGLVDVHDVKQMHPRSVSGRVNSASFKYHVIIGAHRKEVCLDSLLSVLAISVKWLRRMRDLKIAGKTLEDQRGKGKEPNSSNLSPETGCSTLFSVWPEASDSGHSKPCWQRCSKTSRAWFGSGIMSNTTGILLNNHMDDFSRSGVLSEEGAMSAHRNFVEPGKRPLSSMTPSIFTDSEGRVRLVVGSSGSLKIITSVALEADDSSTAPTPATSVGDLSAPSLLSAAVVALSTYNLVEVCARHLWLNDDLKQAIDARRLHHQHIPNTVQYEHGVTRFTYLPLEAPLLCIWFMWTLQVLDLCTLVDTADVYTAVHLFSDASQRNIGYPGHAVAERLDCSPPTKANQFQFPARPLPDYRKCKSYLTIPLAGGSYRGSPVSPALIFRHKTRLRRQYASEVLPVENYAAAHSSLTGASRWSVSVQRPTLVVEKWRWIFWEVSECPAITQWHHPVVNGIFDCHPAVKQSTGYSRCFIRWHLGVVLLWVKRLHISNECNKMVTSNLAEFLEGEVHMFLSHE
ncbi:hypothetical protein PR048_009405 [Dryococelus australis]|uniref:Uncharacterized protein n=1 Tax=Dryococelus australis TaxID=614101 RepID=A0ABQ9I0W6_9NEOP|nr:hypothetical protein PR048_009405 [Dryococelus australis]